MTTDESREKQVMVKMVMGTGRESLREHGEAAQSD